MGMKCSSRYTLAPIDSIFGGQLPPIIPPGARLVEAHSLQSQRRPNSLLSTQECSGGPERRPTPFSSSTVYIPLGCRFCFLDTPGVHGAKILTEHFVTHFPIFSHTKLLLSLFQRKNKGRLIKVKFRLVTSIHKLTFIIFRGKKLTFWDLNHNQKKLCQQLSLANQILSEIEFRK